MKKRKKFNKKNIEKIKLLIEFIFIGLIAIGLGWFIGQVIKMTMEVGG